MKELSKRDTSGLLDVFLFSRRLTFKRVQNLNLDV